MTVAKRAAILKFRLEVNILGYTVPDEPIRARKKCYPPVWLVLKSKYPPLFTFWHSCVTVRALFSDTRIFHYSGAFKTEILHIYSLTAQILKQLSPSVSVTNVRYLPSRPPLVTSTSGDNLLLNIIIPLSVLI